MAIIWVGTGRFNAYIGPVQDYIDRVVAADVAAGNTLGLEVGVRDAYDVFIRDSINVGDLGTSGGVLSQANSIIKAAPIMAGARTLAGALVPLVGTAPTRFGTEGGWNYNRKTGTAGNGTDNYLDSNRNINADPRDNHHFGVYSTAPGNVTAGIIGGRSSPANFGTKQLNWIASTGAEYRSCSGSTAIVSLVTPLDGMYGVSRSVSTSFQARVPTSTSTQNVSSDGFDSANFFIYARNTGGVAAIYSNWRLSFYSIGESLNLALLDARVTTLMNAIAAAIP